MHLHLADMRLRALISSHLFCLRNPSNFFGRKKNFFSFLPFTFIGLRLVAWLYPYPNRTEKTNREKKKVKSNWKKLIGKRKKCLSLLPVTEEQSHNLRKACLISKFIIEVLSIFLQIKKDKKTGLQPISFIWCWERDRKKNHKTIK